MLKERGEDKGAKGVYVGTLSERPIRREDVEDAQRPGHAKAGPYTPDEFQAAMHYGLRRPDGRPFSPLVTTSQDPREPHRSEAPENLRRAVETAERALEEHRAKMRAAADAIAAAEAKWKVAAASQRDAKAYNEGLREEQAARERDRTLCEEGRPLVKCFSDAEREVERWIHDERLYRLGHAPRPEPPVF